MAAWGSTSPTVPLYWANTTSATSTTTLYIVQSPTNFDVTPTVDEARRGTRSTVIYAATNYQPQHAEVLTSRWYDPPIVSPTNRGPVWAYDAPVLARVVSWRSAPRGSARRARYNWRKRPHGSKR